ncbi:MULTISPECIES: ABC transporter ATP-binding protein [Kocuria]|uniref:ABC transporter ATP-binding protein n=1 Tax=Kocuria oceani TaxID=988827 RepID=A0ABV9TK87_9MICC|nr:MULTISPECIES: ABC transporter ATP-binding protein [Kocuria]KLU09627.1 multidrug ABC transporter ATPase [Kocuria sp. SM24M-10]OLT10258.1 ABC transporter ATP-binding protein [Kocuria sp. CNJ-770]
MNPVIEVRNLTKRYKDKLALDDVSFEVQQDTIYGLLGRNGAGKTTAMSILTAQNLPTSGQVRVFGQDPYENARVLSRMCFVRESQKYPDDATPRHAFASARLFFPRWDQQLADALVEDFQLPVKRTIKKLSRGQLSAVGVIIGLASRAEITFFDEPYLGLDAVARQIFYDRLLTDYAEHPRTVLLSSHLIDEVSNLLERVLVIDAGRIIMDESTEDARAQATNVVGDAAAVERAANGREVIHRESLGRVASVTFLGRLDETERAALTAAGLELAPVSLQQLIVRLTQHRSPGRDALDAATQEGALR